jgi:hypothetical protein
MLLESGIQVFHVSAMVHVVMQAHSLEVNCGFDG